MKNNFIEKVKHAFNENEQKNILKALKLVEDHDFISKVFNLQFALGVASGVIDNKLDSRSVIASLFYPLIKNHYDESVHFKAFDKETNKLINSLNAIEKLNITTREEQEDSIRKMFIGVAKDFRVIIIKLLAEVEKLNFMHVLSGEEIEKLMKGYTDIYSPLSAMLGMSQIKNKLENATFKYFKPKLYMELSKVLSEYFEDRNKNIENVIQTIKNQFTTITSDLEVYGRQKQLASIAKKLQIKNMSIDNILELYGPNRDAKKIENLKFTELSLTHIVDILAIRVIVNTVDECYAALGKINSIFKPLGDCKDYIAHPKENGYQSLHTVVLLENGDPLEIQIRTRDMHNYAEYGFAAHWAYKGRKKVNENDVKINYIRSVMELHKEKSSDKLLEILKTDVYNGRIFAQTPAGKILEFPDGSTPIDFAYAIHSKVGDTCIGAKINDKMVPLSTQLNNGDIVEILTSAASKGPSRDWLKICKTSSARSKINSFFKKTMKEDNIKKGKSILDAQAKAKNIVLSNVLNDNVLSEIMDKYSFSSEDDLYASVGHGGISGNQILTKALMLYNAEAKGKEITNLNINVPKKTTHDGQVLVRGYSNMLTKFAKCCNPIPGDEITGYVSRGKGITIHRNDCYSLNYYEFDRLIEASWNIKKTSQFYASLKLLTDNKGDVVSKISKRLNDIKIGLVGISSKNISGQLSIELQIIVKNKKELQDVINKLKSLPFVYDISRNE